MFLYLNNKYNLLFINSNLTENIREKEIMRENTNLLGFYTPINSASTFQHSSKIQIFMLFVIYILKLFKNIYLSLFLSPVTVDDPHQFRDVLPRNSLDSPPGISLRTHACSRRVYKRCKEEKEMYIT